jgi:hypothetical protein
LPPERDLNAPTWGGQQPNTEKPMKKEKRRKKNPKTQDKRANKNQSINCIHTLHIFQYF